MCYIDRSCIDRGNVCADCKPLPKGPAINRTGEASSKQMETELSRQQEIEEYEAYTKTQEYVEEIAKSKLGLVYKDEIIFKEK